MERHLAGQPGPDGPGHHQFLEAVCQVLAGLGAVPVYSPALFPSSTGLWRRAGFEPAESLVVMERPLPGPRAHDDRVRTVDDPPWDELAAIDTVSFDGIWRMGRIGLEEALSSARRGVVLVAGEDGRVDGFAIVGAEFGYSYLNRIAVRPEARGRGIGGALVRAAMDWATRAGARRMILNTQPDAVEVRRLYARYGFVETGAQLLVMCWPGPY